MFHKESCKILEKERIYRSVRLWYDKYVGRPAGSPVLRGGNDLKVLFLSGSPKASGNTAAALAEMKAIFDQESIEAEIVQVGHLPVRGCIACGGCYQQGKCVFDDVVNDLAEKLEAADSLVVASQYWNAVHGGAPGEAARDEEGMQAMRTLARNMSFLMKSIALGRETYGLPEKEPGKLTNFIR